MTDEPRPEEGGTAAVEDTPTQAPPDEGAPEEAKKDDTKIDQAVDITDVGPCKKHIKVTIAKEVIDRLKNDKYSELVKDALVPGFRPGKAPRKLIERQFKNSVTEQIKSEVLMASLQQMAEEHEIAPLSPPSLDPDAIDMPDNGPMVYEFEVEVRPEVTLPEYKGLRLRKPVYTITAEDVDREQRKLVERYGQIVPKEGEGGAAEGDLLTADVTFRRGDQVLGEAHEATFRVEKSLAFKDGLAPRFLEQVAGAKAGETREVEIQLSSAVANPDMAGLTIQGLFNVKDLKTVRLPEVTDEFVSERYGLKSVGQLREALEVSLQRRFDYHQRQSYRQQILEQLAASATWELPQDLLRRQASRAMNRRVMEMRASGIKEDEINRRIRLLQQDVLQSTEQSLKEHFVLQKIADTEKIELNDADLNDAIERLADQEGESPRRVRARIEKENMMEALAAQLIEQRVIDMILDHAEYTEERLEEDQAAEPAVSTAEVQAVPGELQDPTAAPPPEEQTGGETSTSTPS